MFIFVLLFYFVVPWQVTAELFLSDLERAGDHRVLQFICDDVDGPDSNDCIYNQCNACLDPLWQATCVGDHWPAECCNALQRHVWCLTDRTLTCGTSLSDGVAAASLAETVQGFCGEECPINWEGCDNDLLCSCFAKYKTSANDCKYNDDTCRCPLETEFVDCTQPEVDACRNSGLDEVHALRVQQRDEICARAGDTPSIPVPPAFCSDADGPDSEACLDNECIACYEPLFHSTCSGDHYPAECCDSISRYVQCLNDRSLTCGTSRTDGLKASALAKTFQGFCGEECPINWEGCDNDLLCSCFAKYKTSANDCKYNDDTCRCPLEVEFVDCTQPEVDACRNSGLDEVHTQRVQQRDEICERANELSPTPTTQEPTPAPSVPVTRAPTTEPPPVPTDPATNAQTDPVTDAPIGVTSVPVTPMPITPAPTTSASCNEHLFAAVVMFVVNIVVLW